MAEGVGGTTLTVVMQRKEFQRVCYFKYVRAIIYVSESNKK